MLLEHWNKRTFYNTCYIHYRCASDESYDGSKYLAAFSVSMILQSFGTVPLWVLGITYIDGASQHGTAAVHIGNYSYKFSIKMVLFSGFTKSRP